MTVVEPERWARRGVLRHWALTALEIDGTEAVPAGIDGEAAMLTPPIRFTARPRALRVRISARHPGCSPSAGVPDGAWDATRLLVRTAAGRAR